MVLKPLEFSECLADSPWFRSNLHNHENALEEASKKIRNVEQQCRKIINCTLKLSQAQRALANTLIEFKLEGVGSSSQTDDERIIANSLKEFGTLIRHIEEQRAKIVEEAEKLYLDPLQQLVDRINRVTRDEKHKYNKESNKFYTSLEKHLHLSTQRQKVDFREADAQLNVQQRSFCQASLQYVAEVQSIQERLKFEFVETLSSFLYSWLSFYHIGHVIHHDFQEVYNAINGRVQKANESFEATQAEAEELKRRMLLAYFRSAVVPSNSADSVLRPFNSNIKQGYLFVLEKSLFGKAIGKMEMLSKGTSSWNKYYCVYSKETRIFTMIPTSHSSKGDMKGTLEQSIAFKLRTCVRRASDTIDKRFCFDIFPEERDVGMTLQALSEEDRRQWLDAMDGREPVYSPTAGQLPHPNIFDTLLDETGFEFIRQCIRAIEERGIREQGLYRNCGVTSKVQKLMQMALDKRKSEKLNLMDHDEWETRTISSAIKTYLRNLPEPLMTFDLHSHFINAAKMGDAHQRVDHIHYYVYKLPDAHHKMLETIIRHLRRVADLSSENLMSAGNLGVCFGPTLLRPKEETMAAIMDIKFCNVVVEVLITNCQQIFDMPPPQQIGLPCPPKPSHHNLVAVMPPAGNISIESAGVSLASPISSSKSATVSSSSIADSVNSGFAAMNIKSAPPDSFTRQPPPLQQQIVGAANSPRLVHWTPPDPINTTPTRSLASRASVSAIHHRTPSPSSTQPSHQPQPVMVANVRQRQPPPPPPSNGQRASTVAPSSKQFDSVPYPPFSATATLPRSHQHIASNNLANSGDSFASSTSGASSTITPHANTRGAAKMSASTYAPSYNPMASENLNLHYRLRKRHSGGNLHLFPLSDSVHGNLCGTSQPIVEENTHHQIDESASQPNAPNISATSHSLYPVRIQNPIYSNYVVPGAQYQPSRRVRTLYSCAAGHETELSFEAGQIITNVFESKEEGWLVGTLNGKTGLIPANYVEDILGR